MNKIVVYLCLLFILAACSNENGDDSTKKIEITKEFVQENVEVGLTYSEVRARFGMEAISDVVDNTETWLYDSAQYSDFEYNRTLESIAGEEIKAGHLEYQLYINFMEEKAFVYSYFYLGEDGKVWQYQVSSYAEEPLNIPVSD